MEIINPLCLNGEIELENYRYIVKEFSRLHHTLPKKAPITVCINSGGGQTSAGLGLYDMFKETSKHRSLRALVLGKAESMAAIILQAFPYRQVSTHSKVMLHGTSVQFGSMSIGNALSALEDFRRLDECMANIVAMRSGKSADLISELMQQDKHFTAEEAVSFGLADSVYGA
ncbi:MAG: ATP-dependent Clp protease proteolytic subunit 1 [Nitrosomonadaceae bacterium]|nr:ATP-dependent Clp protease proteolytic subunit 1 [Nitrosomonadaceae bacterium]